MLPLSLLRTAQNHPMLVELKNGETYNGHLVSCDNWMNINLREVNSHPTLIHSFICSLHYQLCYLLVTMIQLDIILKGIWRLQS